MKAYVGIEVGQSQLKIVHVAGGKVKKAVVLPMPDSLVKEGRIVSLDACGEVVEKALKENKISCSNAALVIPEERLLVKNTNMPAMSTQQLVYNLPFEFKDYITDEMSSYLFDYAVVSKGEDDTMNIMGVAIKKSLLDEYKDMIRKAGMTLKKAGPELTSMNYLINKSSGYSDDKEYCIIDMGYHSIRMYMFKGDTQTASKSLSHGIDVIERAICEHFRVDKHLAASYMKTNYQDCHNAERVKNVCDNLSLELARALNFYKFSNRDSELSEVWICGGGANVTSLVDSMKETLEDMTIHKGSSLIAKVMSDVDEKDAETTLMAAAMALAAEEIQEKKEGSTPKKSSVNLARLGQKKLNVKLFAGLIAAAVILVALIAKFAVIDRLSEVRSLERQYDDIQTQTEAYYKVISESGDLQDKYAHYTYQYFTDEELKRVDRDKVIDMIANTISSKADVQDWKLEENTLTVNVYSDDLLTINEIAEELQNDEIVDYCVISTARTDSNASENDSYEYVRAELKVYFNDSEMYNTLKNAKVNYSDTEEDEE